MAPTLEIMESQEAILSTLETFLDTRCSLSVSPQGSKDFFSSFIINISDDNLRIDQVIPKTGNALFKPGQQLDVRISHRGIAYRFTSSHLSYGLDEAGFPYHQITMPADIKYLEKRTGYRIHLKLSESQPIWVSIPPEKRFQASLENISQHGACIRIKGNHLPLETCNVIDCNIQIANTAPMDCKAFIRHYQYSAKSDETKAGIEFCQLSFNAEKQLQKVLMKLQRHNIRSDLTL
jgi:c-di-GMP-binding flagellar brake protein YcgR